MVGTLCLMATAAWAMWWQAVCGSTTTYTYAYHVHIGQVGVPHVPLAVRRADTSHEPPSTSTVPQVRCQAGITRLHAPAHEPRTAAVS